MKLDKSPNSEQGSIVLEATGFAVLAFGLIMTLTIQVFEMERRVIWLEALAKNVMRHSLLNSDFDFEANVAEFQNVDPFLRDEVVSASSTCLLSSCSRSGQLVWLEISIDGAKAKVFGVIP